MDGMDSDDSDTPLVRVDSGPKLHDTVPEDTEYHIRLVAVKKHRFLYLLKAGQTLPYEVSLQGHNFMFDKSLTLSMLDGKWLKSLEEKSGTVWNVFKLAPEEPLGEQAAAASETHAEDQSSGPLNVIQEFNANVISLDEKIHLLSKLYEMVDDNARCLLCPFLSPDPNITMTHILDHPNWSQFLPSVMSDVNVNVRKLGNVNNYPEWKEDLKKHFVDEIINKCSQDTRVAWAQNEKLTDQEKFLEVRNEIINKLVNFIADVYGTVSSPSYKTLDSVVKEILAPGYPYMFRNDEDSASSNPNLGFGYGRGGLKGLENLHKNLWDKIYLKQSKLKKEAMIPSTDEEAGDDQGNRTGRKTRRPHKYGVDNDKYYAAATNTEVGEYEATEGVDNEESREQVYSSNRNAIAEKIRSSGKVLNRVVRGFFNSPTHLHQQFLFFSPGSDDLKERIALNWETQIGFMQKYIEKKSKKGKDDLKKLEEKIQLEFGGSVLLQQIMVARMLADLIDGDGKSLFLMENEEIVTNSPFIKVIELEDRSFLFEIWADKVLLLDGQDLMSAMASYFELCFVFQLEYPKQSQTVINILQRKAARYGDDKGTLTAMRKDTATNKIAKYLQVLGDIATGN